MSDEHGGFKHVRENVDGHPIRNLLGYARPYWLRLVVGVVASFCTRFARLVPPIVVAAAINRVVLQSGEPGLLASLGLLPGHGITGQAARHALLERLVVIAVLAYLVRSVARFASRYLLQSTAQKVQRDLRDDTYDHLQHLSMDFFVNHQTGGMMSILNSDINRLEKFLNTEFRQLIRVVATVGGIGVVLWLYSPKLALIALAPVPIIGVASGRFLTWIEPRYKSIRETVARLNTRLENNLGGAAVIKAFNRYGFERERVAEQSQTYHDEKVGALRIRRAFFAGLRLLTGVVFVLVLYVGGSDIVAGAPGALSAGAFALFFLYLRRLYSPMRRVGKSANKYQLAKSSAERVFGLLGRTPTITSPEDPYVPAAVDGRVTFDDATFGYDDQPVLTDVSLDVPAGATVGLAGTSGAGKSTLLKLIPRFHDVDAGAVRVDGVDVRDYDLETLRESVAVVEQNPYLFSGTIAENIAYGDRELLREEWEADAETREAVVEAAEAAEADAFIGNLPEGYDTLVGERGVKLSGGQRQRVAIARALLNDPEIIVFDEATSDVDTETEELIQESIDRLIEDRTAFVIAHRLSTIRDADRIVVMADGEIVETGTHDELLAADRGYAALWEAQAEDDPASTTVE
ncbi:ATP-binding cassette subfamily B protein [Halarchaeum rubridurum]|uniref:ATP-binding cassette subfamily B protein n=1 Tax=Halarchaeum rubridurum TaxID=489911 RepID=A0A830FR29_9EURY|nr:ABC transporter ATP-binding protein [Halarchaeum rubridurum]MBP1954666.1 ATP-binding cassette subfamily B protein [Halarchaeum rubridurum]GGM62882.1 multidrug ABC transporter ATP-binding protein [Halarchaeum rubridurum]